MTMITKETTLENANQGADETSTEGAQINGTELNGVRYNGVKMNGVSYNGAGVNGIRGNGTAGNGIRYNGTDADGMQSPDIAPPEPDVGAIMVEEVELADGRKFDTNGAEIPAPVRSGDTRAAE